MDRKQAVNISIFARRVPVVSSAQAADTERLNGSNTMNQAEYKAKQEANRTAKNPLSMCNNIHYSKHFYNFPMRIFMQNATLHYLLLKKKGKYKYLQATISNRYTPNVKELVRNGLEDDETVWDNVVS